MRSLILNYHTSTGKECRLVFWHNSDIPALLKEGKCIQDHLQSSIQLILNLNTLFEFLISHQISAVLKLLTEDTKGSILSLDSQIPCGLDRSGGTLLKSVWDILAEKHPLGCVASADTV